MDPDGGGAKYWQSEKFGIFSKKFLQDPVITPPVPDAIAGLLAHWVSLSSVVGFTSATVLLTYSYGTS